MEIPAMSVGGVAPVFSLWTIMFFVMSVAGAFALLLVLMRRNWRLVRHKGFNPFSLEDAQRAADPSLSTRLPGEAPLLKTLWGRGALAALSVGLVGLVATALISLFAR